MLRSKRKRRPMKYEAFRAGYTYYDVYYMVYARKYKRRRGVLGFWRQLKLQMYAEYLRNFYAEDEVPF
jgi:hypothetical protein